MIRRVLIAGFIMSMAQPAHAMLKTACTSESLASEEFRRTLRARFLWDNIGAKGKMRPTEEDYLPLCLEGVV